MCVAVISKPNTPRPSIETMEHCFKRNPDGSGFMYNLGGVVHYKKGMMTFEEFRTEYEKLLSTLPATSALVIHHRIGTNGLKKAPIMTHPFVVSEKPEDLKSLEGECRMAFAHNGVLSGPAKDNELSDTAMYVKDVLYPLVSCNTPKTVLDKMVEYTRESSRFVYLKANGDLTWFGSWETEPDGNIYSNTSWKPYVAPVTTYSNTGKTAQRNLLFASADTKPFEPITFPPEKELFLRKLTKEVLVDGIKLGPNDFPGTELFVYLGDELFLKDGKEYLLMGYLDVFGENFDNIDEFLASTETGYGR